MAGRGRGKERRKAGGRKSHKQCWTFAWGPGRDSFSHNTKPPVLPAAAKHDLVSHPLRNRTFGTQRGEEEEYVTSPISTHS